jgi:hypothetical protein
MPDLSEIQQIQAVLAVKADYIMAEALQMPSGGATFGCCARWPRYRDGAGGTE